MIFTVTFWIGVLWVMVTHMHASLNLRQRQHYFELYIGEDEELFKKHRGDVDAYMRDSKHLYLAYLIFCKGVFGNV